MTTIRDLLKETRPLPDTTKVKLQLHVPLGKVRINAKVLASLDVLKAILDRGKGSTQKKAKSNADTTIENQEPATKATPKVTAKKKNKADSVKKAAEETISNADATVKTAKTKRVTQATVLKAIGANHSTTQAIADAINASPLQVRKALSRYTQQGLIERTKPGQYALKQ